MSRRLDQDVTRAAKGALGVRRQLQRMIDRLLTRHRLAQAVFIGADGQPTPAAKKWLHWLARSNFVASTTYVAGDRDAMLKNEGRRELALEILGSLHLDMERLNSLTRLEREAKDD